MMKDIARIFSMKELVQLSVLMKRGLGQEQAALAIIRARFARMDKRS
jgi:hypothetical protein